MLQGRDETTVGFKRAPLTERRSKELYKEEEEEAEAEEADGASRARLSNSHSALFFSCDGSQL